MTSFDMLSYANPGSLMAVAVCFLAVSTVLVSLRMLSRYVQRLGFGVDDTFILLAWLATVGLCVNMIIAVTSEAWGLPALLFDQDGNLVGVDPLFYKAQEFFWVQEVILPAQLAFTKLSVLMFYRRVLVPATGGYLYWTTTVLIVIIALWGLVLPFVFLFQCGTDFSSFWAPADDTSASQCLPQSPEVFTLVSDAALDVVIFFLPMWRIVMLQLTTYKKFLAIGVFAVGAMSVIASLVRLAWYLPTIQALSSQDFEADPNVITSTIAFWNVFEAGFAITTACMPSVKYYFDVAAGRLSSGPGSQDCARGTSVSKLRPVGPPEHQVQGMDDSSDMEKGGNITIMLSDRPALRPALQPYN